MKKYTISLLLAMLAGLSVFAQGVNTMTVNFTVSYSDASTPQLGCNSSIQLTFYDQNDNPLLSTGGSLDGLSRNVTKNFTATVNVPASGKISYFITSTAKFWPGSNGKCGTDAEGSAETGAPVNITQTSACFNTHVSGAAPLVQGSFDLSIVPQTLLITSPNMNLMLPTDDKISLEGTPDFIADAYSWQYGIVDATNTTQWYDFPAALQSNRTPSFSATDLLGSLAMSLLGKNIFFRIKNTCYTSPVTSLNVRLSSPHIVSVTPVSPLCANESTGSLKIRFSRPMLTDEMLNIFLNDASGNPLASAFNLSKDQLDASNTYTWDPLLAARTYNIALLGKHPQDPANPADDATFTDGAAHSAIAVIDPRNALVVNPIQLFPVNCFGGSDGKLSVNLSGGAGNYQAAIGPDFNWISLGSVNTYSFTGLPAGTYEVQVRDGNGCQPRNPDGSLQVIMKTITQPVSPLQIDFSEVTAPLENGVANGNIKVRIIGGTPDNAGNYSIQWLDENNAAVASFTAGVVNGTFETILQQIPAGKYTLYVSDANTTLATAGNMAGCMVTGSFTVTEPAPLTVTLSQTATITCPGVAAGELTAMAQGGVPISLPMPYTYRWYRLSGSTRTDMGITNPVATHLLGGTYLVQATDGNNIIGESAPFILAEPAPIVSIPVTEDIRCFKGTDGLISLQTQGGTAPYSMGLLTENDLDYNWIPFKGLLATDTGSLQAGAFVIKIKDANGCYEKEADGSEKTYVLTIHAPVEAVQVTGSDIIAPTSFTNPDGKIRVRIKGGTLQANPLYKVEWYDEQHQSLGSYTAGIVNGNFETQLQQVTKGVYSIKVYDGVFDPNDPAKLPVCFVTQSFTVIPPDPIMVNLEQKGAILCHGGNGGALTAHAQGGIQSTGLPYRYQWFRIENAIRIPFVAVDSNATGLVAGTYLVSITDQNNISKESAPFVIAEPASLLVSLVPTPVSCVSGMNGTVEATVTGGTYPYTYNWSNNKTTAKIEGLAAGKYLVFVNDVNGCETSGQVAVVSPFGVQVTAVAQAPLCDQACNGAVQLTVNGGQAPYSYWWNTGASSRDLAGLCAGEYQVTITDAAGCRTVYPVKLDNPAPVQVNLGPDRTLCKDQAYEADATISDSSAQYVWTGANGFSAGVARVKLTDAGMYHVTVTDGKGCTGADSIYIVRSTQDIDASFVVSSQVFANEDVVFVNISNPQPESQAWIIPTQPAVHVVAQSAGELRLNFGLTGEYTIGLQTKIGGCEKTMTKKIVVLDKQVFEEAGTVKDPFILEFNASPNPNNGHFTVKVALTEKAPIRLRIINIKNYVMAADRSSMGKDTYQETFDLPYRGPGDIYLITLETAKGSRIFKILTY